MTINTDPTKCDICLQVKGVFGKFGPKRYCTNCMYLHDLHEDKK